MNFFKSKKQELGLTLIEMMMVVVIIGTLSGLIIVNNLDAVNRASITKVKAFATGIPVTLAGNYVASWRFDQISGSAAPYTILDSYGANTGTLGDGTCAPGSGACPTQLSESSCVFGQCLSFDGVDDYVNCGHDTILNFSAAGAMTIGAWVKATNGTGGHRIVSKEGTNAGYTLTWEDNRLYFYNPNGWGAKWANTILKINQWYYIVVVYNNQTIQYYINGIADGSGTAGTFVDDSTSDVVIGVWTTQTFNGAIDDVAIYNDALVISKIKQNYLVGLKNLLNQGQISQVDYADRLNNLNQNLAQN